MVTELMRRLEEASIDSFSVIERDVLELYFGATPSVSIWVKDAEHLPRARELFREVLAQRTELKCVVCGYNLRGHSGEGTCPECGEDTTAKAPDRPCPQCHEAVPHDFEVCWNCGADLRVPDQRDT